MAAVYYIEVFHAGRRYSSAVVGLSSELIVASSRLSLESLGAISRDEMHLWNLSVFGDADDLSILSFLEQADFKEMTPIAT